VFKISNSSSSRAITFEWLKTFNFAKKIVETKKNQSASKFTRAPLWNKTYPLRGFEPASCAFKDIHSDWLDYDTTCTISIDNRRTNLLSAPRLKLSPKLVYWYSEPVDFSWQISSFVPGAVNWIEYTVCTSRGLLDNSQETRRLRKPSAFWIWPGPSNR